MAETIQPAALREEARRRYLNYALSVITSRALPDIRDGLKPVQRRILYTMYNDLNLTNDGRPRKCAKIVGDVIGNYHPHGDVAAYEALVRLAQNWVLRAPLVQGQGNFGSVDGDSAASMRYTEAKLTPISERLMSELGQGTVAMRFNYDNTRREPVILPAQFPNLLVNGTSGIAVGLATNIPPHNLGEVIRGCIHLIDNPDATVAQLMDRIKGPDFPLGGKVVTDRPSLRKIYEEGTGSIKVQGEWAIEKVGRRNQIVITSIPYAVDKGKLESDIGAIIESKKLPQLLNLVNESNEKDGMRIVLEYKADTDANLIMAYLYRHTSLQQNFSYNLTCLVPMATRGSAGTEEEKDSTRPERLNLKSMLRYFLDFRFATVRRRFEFDLKQLLDRIHILEGFRIIFNALDRAIRIIRESNGKADANERLQASFKIDSVQANAILDAQLYKIAQMEIKKILDELREKTAAAEKIRGILASNTKLWNVIKTELNDLGEKYSDRRRTRMASAEDTPEFDPEAYIVRENTNVVLTRDGWIKRVGRLASVETTRLREGDEVIAVVPGNTVDHVVFFADDGTAYTLRIQEVPASSGYGEPLAKFFRLADQVRVIAAVTTDERFTGPDEVTRSGEPAGPYLLVVTAQGQTLRAPFAPFRTASTKAGRRYVRLAEGDKVVLAGVITDDVSLFLVSRSGRFIHFPIDEINILSGAGKGVMGIKLEGSDVCIGGRMIGPGKEKMEVETANEKVVEFTRRRYETTSRGGKGFEAVKRTSFLRVLPAELTLVDWEKIESREDRKKKSDGGSDQKKLFD